MFNFLKNRKNGKPGPDYSSIDSAEKARMLFEEGKLEKLYLMPLEFGGTDIEANILYAPNAAIVAKEGIDQNVIQPLIQNGEITNYEASPTYSGRSFIPTSIVIKASGTKGVTTTIRIWGDEIDEV